MPIKFRCRQCRQFLGISRSRAGEITDCPQCGKSIRIPNLDGSVAPIPEPELNLKDAQLVDALGELAQLGSRPHQAKSLPESAEPPLPAEHDSPQPAPMPEAIAVPVAVPAQTAPAPSPNRSEPEIAPGKTDDDGTHEALRSLAESVVEPRPAARPEGADNEHWKIVVLTVGALGLLVTVWFMRGSNDSTNAVDDSGPDVAAAADSPRDVTARQASENAPALTGRITYITDTGDSRADSGASVILLPQPRTGHVKLDVAGFLSGADEVDRQTAAAALRVLGGDVTTTDDDGQYRLSVTTAGNYSLLVISHHQTRDTGQPIESLLQETLSDYFFRPSSLLGRLAFHFDDFHYRGQGTSPRDFTFAAE